VLIAELVQQHIRHLLDFGTQCLHNARCEGSSQRSPVARVNGL
jgi:hypothetical protein